MKIHGIILLISGIALMIISISAAVLAPVGASYDVRRFMTSHTYINTPDDPPGYKGLLIENQSQFYQAHVTKRFILATLIGVLGVSLVVLGCARLTAPEEVNCQRPSA